MGRPDSGGVAEGKGLTTSRTQEWRGGVPVQIRFAFCLRGSFDILRLPLNTSLVCFEDYPYDHPLTATHQENQSRSQHIFNAKRNDQPIFYYSRECVLRCVVFKNEKSWSHKAAPRVCEGKILWPFGPFFVYILYVRLTL